ncbi:hypothetical protein MHK_007530 [Candidatus Magnetomorum sp. HK-1]|nr:hypothetical protein MHK_007530 [Candidatus Magnetomorum sp. HK-1]
MLKEFFPKITFYIATRIGLCFSNEQCCHLVDNLMIYLDDLRWKDFTYDGNLSNPVIKLGRRTFAENYDEVSDGWDTNIPSQLFAINFILIKAGNIPIQ